MAFGALQSLTRSGEAFAKAASLCKNLSQIGQATMTVRRGRRSARSVRNAVYSVSDRP